MSIRALVIVAALAVACPAQDGYRKIVAAKQRELAREIASYLQQNPQAKDAEAAGEWLIKYALQSGQEAEVADAVESFLRREGLDGALVAQGQQALSLGLVKSERIDAALDVFDKHLRGVRPTSAARSLEFAHQLAAQARLAGDFEASRAVYLRLMDALPLNPIVAETAQLRINKLELAKKPAPPLTAQDLHGRDLNLAGLSGKVVVVDFWGTTCQPCLEEMPRMKALYRDYKDQGLEIIGISLDERPSIVSDYVEQAGLTWKMALNRQPNGSLTEAWKVVLIPSLFVIDRKGNVAQVDVYGDNLRAVVEKLLGDE